jgi:hypothetical protein
VRDRELNCYQGWGRDFWEPKASASWDRNGNDGGHRLTLEQADPQSFDSQSQWQSTTGRPRSFVLIHQDDWS